MQIGQVAKCHKSVIFRMKCKDPSNTKDKAIVSKFSNRNPHELINRICVLLSTFNHPFLVFDGDPVVSLDHATSVPLSHR
jgi:hypothetical protein